jgi:hypothetical protein
MANHDDQAQADSAAQADDQTAVNQATDVTDSQEGTNPLAAYEAELARAMSPAEESGAQEESAQDEELADADQSEQESGADGADEGATEQSSDESDGDQGDGETVTQMRPRLKDPLDIAVAALAKAKGISLIDAAKIVAGEQPAPNPTERQGQEEDSQEAVETVASITDEIDRLIEEQAEKTSNLEFESAAAIGKQIEKLRNKREDVRFEEAQEKSRAKADAEQKFYEAFRKSEEKTIKYYPDAAKHDSPLAKKMAELHERHKQMEDPLAFDSDAPWTFAKKAAVALGIPMTDPAAPAKPAAKANANRPIQPAGGNARTTAPTTAVTQIDQAVASVTDEAAYDKLLAELGIA